MDYSTIPPLDENVWETLPLAAEELEFLASHTRIQDPESLKRHVIAVQVKAYDVHNYPCIQRFNFVRSNRITRLLGYRKALALQRERPGALFLDLAFGTEVRKLVVDGYPADNIVACDLHREFWDLGHELYKSTPATFPVSFIAGDIFDEKFFSLQASNTPSLEPPALGSLTTLTPLKGTVSIIHASSFFHLFDEQTQTTIARILASLLSPLPGSIIFGAHVGNEHGTAQYPRMPYFPGDAGGRMFCHSPETWQEMWVNVFGEGVVRVEVVLNEHRKESVSSGKGNGWLNWCVVRV